MKLYMLPKSTIPFFPEGNNFSKHYVIALKPGGLIFWILIGIKESPWLALVVLRNVLNDTYMTSHNFLISLLVGYPPFFYLLLVFGMTLQALGEAFGSSRDRWNAVEANRDKEIIRLRFRQCANLCFNQRVSTKELLGITRMRVALKTSCKGSYQGQNLQPPMSIRYRRGNPS